MVGAKSGVLPHDQWVCIHDFAGGMRIGRNYVNPVNQWADWDGEKVVFGGAWFAVPDLPVPDGPPDEAVVLAHAAKHWNAEAWYDEVLRKVDDD